MKIRCKHCKRYLFESAGTVVIQGFICPNSDCKARLNLKIVNQNTSIADIKAKFMTQEAGPK